MAAWAARHMHKPVPDYATTVCHQQTQAVPHPIPTTRTELVCLEESAMPDLEMQLGPALHAPAGVVDVCGQEPLRISTPGHPNPTVFAFRLTYWVRPERVDAVVWIVHMCLTGALS